MILAIKLILLCCYFAVMIGIGFYCRKHATDVNGFVLGGRSVGPWLTAFAYGTSYFSAVIFVGYAGQFGWRFGLASTWIGLGNAFLGSLLAWAVLGRRTRIMTQHLDSATMPQFFAKRFHSNGLKLTASLIIFVFLIPYTASLYNGLSRLFEMAFNIDYTICIVIMAVLTAIYVIAGGYMATAINDFLQGCIMLVGIVLIIGAVLKLNGGFMGSYNALSNVTDETVSELSGAFTSFLGPHPLQLFFVVILTSLGTWGLPQMVQKFYSIKSENDVQKGTVISTIFAIVVAGGCYFLGGFGRLFGIETNPDTGALIYDSVVPHMLSYLSPLMIAIVLILVLSASMSTLSSLVLTSASTLTLDFINPVIAKDKASEKSTLVILKIFVAVFILISSVIAIVQYKSSVTFIAQMMGLSWGALAGAFLAPFLYGLYWKKTTKLSCYVSFMWGALFMIVTTVFKTQLNLADSWFWGSPINTGVVAMIGGLVLVPVVSGIEIALRKAMRKEPSIADQEIEEIFSCYSKKVTVPVTEALSGDNADQEEE